VAQHMDSRSLDYAEKTHAVIRDELAKIDTKASIILTLETALLGLGIAAPQHLAGEWTGVAGLLLLAAAILCAGYVIFPQLQRARTGSAPRLGVYFGGLRLFEPSGLVAEYHAASEEQQLAAYAEQVVLLSRLIWRKHTWIQVSLILAVAAGTVLAVSLAA